MPKQSVIFFLEVNHDTLTIWYKIDQCHYAYTAESPVQIGREQRNTMSQIQEERRTLATERAQLSSAHRDLISREKLKTETSVQVLDHVN